jgi:glycerol-3-phosphate O-acyltransferase/dihydroxyacetone phosphate acyltransferase
MFSLEILRELALLLMYDLVCGLFKVGTSVFFREVLKRGSHQIPPTGAVIFVAAPHSNQFVDPLIVMQTCPRPVRFLMAASSMSKGVPGFFGRLLRCIPVERAMDSAKHGSGEIKQDPIDRLKILGIGTKFRTWRVPRNISRRRFS